MPETRNVPPQQRPPATDNANTPSTGTVFPNPLQAGNARTPSSDLARAAQPFGPEVAEQAQAMPPQWAGHQPTQVVHTEDWQMDPMRQAAEARSQHPLPTREAVVAERQAAFLGCLTLLPDDEQPDPNQSPAERQAAIRGDWTLPPWVPLTEDGQQDPNQSQQQPIPTRAAMVAEGQAAIPGGLTLPPGPSLDGSTGESRPGRSNGTRSGPQRVDERRPEEAEEDAEEMDTDWLEDGEDELWKEARRRKSGR